MKRNRGQTFVEVIVVVSIVIIIVTSLVFGSISSLKITGYNSLKSQAVKYAQEGVELARKDRDNSWNTFLARGNPPKTWCLDKLGAWTQQTPCPVNIDTTFTRTLAFTYNAARSRMEIVVTVTWKDGATTRVSKIETFFTQWR